MELVELGGWGRGGGGGGGEGARPRRTAVGPRRASAQAHSPRRLARTRTLRSACRSGAVARQGAPLTGHQALPAASHTPSHVSDWGGERGRWQGTDPTGGRTNNTSKSTAPSAGARRPDGRDTHGPVGPRSPRPPPPTRPSRESLEQPCLQGRRKAGENALSVKAISERGRGTSDYKGRLSPGAGPRRAAPARSRSLGPAVDVTRKAFL